MSLADLRHKKFPYLLKGLTIDRADQVWASDITYVRMRHGFIYLVAILDWFSRYVVSWAVSITLDAEFCIEALRDALSVSKPEIFNSDQGCQFTSTSFIGVLEAAGIAISMDGRGRAFDNIFVERLWRSVKYEEVYLREYDSVREACTEPGKYISLHNQERPHQDPGYKTPYQVYSSRDSPRHGQTIFLARKENFSTLKKPIFCLDRGVHLSLPSQSTSLNSQAFSCRLEANLPEKGPQTNCVAMLGFPVYLIPGDSLGIFSDTHDVQDAPKKGKSSISDHDLHKLSIPVTQ